VTLSAPNDKVYVWENADRSGTKYINQVDWSYTWTIGVNAPLSRTVYVEAINGSAAVDDIWLTLEANDAGATPATMHTTSTTATSQPATAVKVAIKFRGQDVTSKRSTDVLIGEKIDPTAEVTAPAGWLPAADGYTWVVPGPTFKDFVGSEALGQVTYLGPDDVRHQSVAFYWYDASPSGVERTVYVATTVHGSIYQRYSTYKVFEPTATITETLGTIKLWYFTGFPPLTMGLYGATHDFGGMDWRIRVNVPAGHGFAEGTWQLVQLVNPHIEMDDDMTWAAAKNDEWYLDDAYPYQGTHPTGQPPVWQNDNPGINLEHASLVDSTRVLLEAHFKTWLMFRPAGADSRFVPLKKETWGFGAQTPRADPATGAAGWQDPPTITVPPYTSGFFDTAEFPLWTQVIHGEDMYDWVPHGW
jgi:hypothetical protein